MFRVSGGSPLQKKKWKERHREILSGKKQILFTLRSLSFTVHLRLPPFAVVGCRNDVFVHVLQDMVRELMDKLRDHPEQSLQFLRFRLDFNQHYSSLQCSF